MRFLLFVFRTDLTNTLTDKKLQKLSHEDIAEALSKEDDMTINGKVLITFLYKSSQDARNLMVE